MSMRRRLGMRFSTAALVLLTGTTASGADSRYAQTNPTTETLRWVSFLDEDTGWAVGYGGAILKTTNGGTLWTPQTLGIIERLLAVHFVDPDDDHPPHARISSGIDPGHSTGTTPPRASTPT